VLLRRYHLQISSLRYFNECCRVNTLNNRWSQKGSGSLTCIWAHHTVHEFKQKPPMWKNQSLFSIVAIHAKFSTICQVHATMVPRKIGCYKVVAVRVKISPWSLAVQRLVLQYATKKIQIMAFSADLMFLFWFLWWRFFMNHSFKTVDFF
jgi:hypothetical protein